MPKRRTVVSEVLKYWREQGRVAYYSDLEGAYLTASKELGFYAQKDYVGHNLTRLLKKHGVKCGAPGTRTPWVLRDC